MINKQRKPLQCRSFHWPWLLFTFLAMKQYVFERARSGTLSFTITVATNQRIQAVTIAKVLFFKTFQLYSLMVHYSIFINLLLSILVEAYIFLYKLFSP